MVRLLSPLFAISLLAGPGYAQFSNPAEHEAIAYSTTSPTDAIARLQERIDAGAVELAFDGAHGFLKSLLAELDIPVSSQSLVFSRTSLQVDRITPWSPRAVYFNDDVYVGWVQGGPVIEIASADPNLGAVFYTLPQDKKGPPMFQRETSTCLMCHDSASITGGVPGFVLRSVLPDRYGYTIAAVSDRATTDRTPFEERWGGWYVTGTHGDRTHAGNAMSPRLMHEVGNIAHYAATFELDTGGNVTALNDRFDTSPYLSPHSDIVALLVLSHQAFVHNLITSANYEARKALYDERIVLSSVGRAGGEPSPVTVARIERATEPLVRGLLFVRADPLETPVRGTSGFATEFAAKGPKDDEGRSLRDFDLQKRLFRYPLSFLIYSESFDALPDVAKRYVYRRLGEVLRGEDQSPDFAHLSPRDRASILEILQSTMPGVLPDTVPASP